MDEALELAQRARTLAPDSGTIIDTLGWIEHLRGNSAEAVKLLREAAKRSPDHAEIRLHAAIAFASAGFNPEAREHLEAALKLDSSLESRDDVRKLVERLRK
jgi:Flp pilus assembly protein TadD